MVGDFSQAQSRNGGKGYYFQGSSRGLWEVGIKEVLLSDH